MADSENDLLAEAIAATDVEIFNEGFDKEESGALDESGDRSLEAMGDGLEGQHEPDEEDEEGEGEGDSEEGGEEGEGEGKDDAENVDPNAQAQPKPTDPEPTGRVPAGRLREQTERAKAAEAERDALKAQIQATEQKHKSDLDALNAKFDAVLQMVKTQNNPTLEKKTEQPAPDEIPDMFEDPKGFAEYLKGDFKRELAARDKQIADMRAEHSLQIAHTRYGAEFEAAFDAVKKLDPQNPENRQLVQRMYASPNPGEALVQWHKRNEVQRIVGSDPVKYKEQVAAETREALMKDPEFRKQLIEELTGEATIGDHGRPRTSVRLPKSLNQAAGNSGRGLDTSALDNSDDAVFRSAFSG